MSASSTHSEPSVTLFIMGYRHEAVIRDAVRSAFGQTYPNLEILLSDDASPDGTHAAMKEMAAAYDGPHRVRLNRNRDNLGIMGHANRIMDLASSPWVAGLGGDDLCTPDRIARQMDALAQARREGRRPLAAHCARQRISPDGTLQEIRPVHPGLSRPPPLHLMDVLRDRASACGTTMIWSRELFDFFGPMRADRSGVEDITITLRAILLGDLVAVDAPLVMHREGGESSPDALLGRGRQHLSGHRLKKNGWWRAAACALLQDLERLEGLDGPRGRDGRVGPDAPDGPEIREAKAWCRRHADLWAFQSALSKRSGVAVMAHAGEALRLTLRHRDRRFLAECGKYLLSDLYVAYHDRRYGRPAP